MDKNTGTLKYEYRHTPVLLNEVLEFLEIKPNDIVCDCTLGGAGHSICMGQKLDKRGILLGIDQDDAALQAANERFEKSHMQAAHLTLKGNFGELDTLLQRAQVPGIDKFLFDLGVSSPQLDVPGRGFSFHEDALLDMRMDPRKQSLNAQEIVNTYNEADLTWILNVYGDERWASRIAKFICKSRQDSPINTTLELVEIIKNAIPASARRSGGHPARKTFQALRIAVNDEIGVLERGLEQALRWLNPNGRIAVISYHSLEDRVVKKCFKKYAERKPQYRDLPIPVDEEEPILKVLTRKPVVPTDNEIKENNRARSAKLRVALKRNLNEQIKQE